MSANNRVALNLISLTIIQQYYLRSTLECSDSPRRFNLSLAPSSVLSVPGSSQGFVALEIDGEQILLPARYPLPDGARCRIASAR